MTVAELTPSQLFRRYTELSTEVNARRAAHALDLVMRVRGHGAGVELQAAMNLSRSSLHDYRKGKVLMSPETVYRLAVIYASEPIPSSPSEVDAIIAAGDLSAADDLFPRFYSDDHRDAVTWLSEHRSRYFAWNIVDQAPLVA